MEKKTVTSDVIKEALEKVLGRKVEGFVLSAVLEGEEENCLISVDGKAPAVGGALEELLITFQENAPKVLTIAMVRAL
jgi:hypothetical protein